MSQSIVHQFWVEIPGVDLSTKYSASLLAITWGDISNCFGAERAQIPRLLRSMGFGKLLSAKGSSFLMDSDVDSWNVRLPFAVS